MNNNIYIRLSSIENRLDRIENDVKDINRTLTTLDNSIKVLISKLDTKDDEMLRECKKMGAHIDFIENVYDNVKHPLGYICNKIKHVTGNNYDLTDSDPNITTLK